MRFKNLILSDTEKGGNVIPQYVLFATALLLTVIPGYLWIRYFKERLPSKRWQVLLFITVLAIFSFLCAKLFAVIEFSKIEAFTKNMRIYGAILVPPIVSLIAFKILKWPCTLGFDVMTVIHIWAIMLFRLICFIQGCCYGKLITPIGDLRWPIREAEIVLFIILLVTFIYRILKGRSRGYFLPIFLISYGSLRFILEFFRVEYVSVGVLHVAHLWSILSIAIGLSAYIGVSAYESAEKNKKRTKHKLKRS